MRIRKILLMLFIITIFLWNANESVFAMNTGLSTENMDPQDQQIFLSNINLSLIKIEPKQNSISCFDVNDNGLIAIGSANSTDKSVLVYAPDGTFQYGYTFDCSGEFRLEWDDDNIIIYWVRSDVAVLVDEEGKIIEIKEIQNTMENNSYWNHFVSVRQRTVNGSQYTMKNNMGPFNIFASSYSQLIRTDADGNITTIYDISREYTVKFIIASIVVILCVVFGVWVLVLQTIHLRKTR